MEFSLLEFLMRNPRRVLTKKEILERVWEQSFIPKTNVLAVQVGLLRRKLDIGFDERLIHTVRGIGYILRAG
jgi:DNA-binding response OmpR family regulator